jgi:hypothetical protein
MRPSGQEKPTRLRQSPSQFAFCAMHPAIAIARLPTFELSDFKRQLPDFFLRAIYHILL